MQLANRVLVLAGYALLVLATVTLGLGGWLASRALLFNDQAVLATGTVVGYRESRPGDGRIAYTPRITFTSGPGERTTIFGQLTSTTQRYPVGSQLPLRYLAEDPGSARIDTFLDNALGPSAALGLGFTSLFAAWVLMRSGRGSAA